jgi:tetratricopeptide (TPR) repeat protein
LFSSSNILGWHQNPQAEAHADRGMQLAQAGNFAAAEGELRQAVELAPAEPSFLAGLGTVLAMEQKLDESTRIFQRALKLDPADMTVRRYLAANLWQLHRYPEAKQNLELVLKQKPGDEQTLLLLGMVSENMKDYATAAKTLASVPALVRQRPESIAALARSYYHVGEKEKAQGTLAELQTHPAGVQGVLLGAQIADEMQDYDTAEKMLVSIQPTFPDRAALGYKLALVQYHAKRFAESQQTLLDLIASEHAPGAVYNLLGWCYQQQNQPKEAVGALEQAISAEPTQEANYLDLGRILLANRSLPAALEAAKRTTKVFPDSPQAFLLEGSVELKMSQFTDAAASHTRAVRLAPADPDGYLGLAEAQFAAGMTKEATATFNAAIKRFPKDARFPLQFAVMLLKEAETGNAVAETRAGQLLQSALVLDGSLAEAHYQLGNLILQKGRAAEALKYLEKASKFGPQSTKTHFTLARAYRQLGRKDDAAKEMDLYGKLKAQETQNGSAPAGMSRD